MVYNVKTYDDHTWWTGYMLQRVHVIVHLYDREKMNKKKTQQKYLNTISIICLCTAYILRCCCCYSISSMSHHEAPNSLLPQPLYATMCAWCPFIFLLTLDVFFLLLYAFIDGGDGGCWASFCPVSAYGTVCINRLWGHFARFTNGIRYTVTEIF